MQWGTSQPVGPSTPRQIPGTDADGILKELTVRQHLTPHRPLGDVVTDLVERLGACPVAADRAISRLELDPSRPVGRLKRGELIQLARSMYRLWAQALAHTPPTPTHSAPNTHPA